MSAEPAKVLYLSGEYTGNSRLLNSMVLRLPALGFETRSAYLFGEPDGRNELDAAGKTVYLRLPGSHRAHVRIARALGRLFAEHRPDIVHCHRHKLLPDLAVATKSRPKIKLLVHLHGLRRVRGLARRAYYALFAGRVSRFVAVSEAARRDLCARSWRDLDRRSITIRNGIELDLIDAVRTTREEARDRMGVPRDAYVIGSVGRLAETKGHLHLIRAMPAILEGRSDAILVIAGQGPLEDALKREAASKAVRFLGYRTDVFDLMRGFDLFAFPSLAEGLGLVLLEAMASRLPVVASRVGGIPEVFGDARIGSMVPPKDPKALAAAVLEVSAMPAKELGERARKRVEDAFSARGMTEELARLYRRILAER